MKVFDYIQQYFKELWELSNEMAPYLLLGFLIAGILHVFLPKYQINKFIGKPNLKSSIYSSILGIPLPLCSCGVIPTGVSFYKNGASKGSTVSFLISTPQTGVDSILVTYSMLGLPFAIVRPIIAFITGVFGGWFTDKLSKPEKAHASEESTANSKDTQTMSFMDKMKEMWDYAFVEFLNDISKWLVVGLAIAALIAVVIPENFFGEYVTNEALGLLMMLVLSIPMYVCATASVPVAAVLIAKGLSPGAALVFLMAGPATNMATIMVIGNSMGRRTLILYLAAIIGGAVLFGFIINEIDYFRSLFTLQAGQGMMHHHFIPSWIGVSSTVFLLFLIINGYFKMRTSKSKFAIKKEDQNVMNLNVKGMSCSHCEINVQNNVSKIQGVDSVEASFANERVNLAGNNIDIENVKRTIKDLGYEVVD